MCDFYQVKEVDSEDLKLLEPSVHDATRYWDTPAQFRKYLGVHEHGGQLFWLIPKLVDEAVVPICVMCHRRVCCQKKRLCMPLHSIAAGKHFGRLGGLSAFDRHGGRHACSSWDTLPELSMTLTRLSGSKSVRDSLVSQLLGEWWVASSPLAKARWYEATKVAQLPLIRNKQKEAGKQYASVLFPAPELIGNQSTGALQPLSGASMHFATNQSLRATHQRHEMQ